MRPTGVDRWNRQLYATDTKRWGGFDPKTGSIRLSEDGVLRHLTGSVSKVDAAEQAQALATVLHELTHAGMETDAPNEPNAVRSLHSQGAMEGIAELRALNDFIPFSVSAGYPGLRLPAPQRAGAYAAMDSLVTQASGPAKDRYALIREAVHGPGVMHFDQLSDGVVRNRLAEVVPHRTEDQLAVRAALIQTMTHDHWPTLPDVSAGTGTAVAEDIRRRLNAKVEEIRHHYQAHPRQPFPADFPNQHAVSLAAQSQPSPSAPTTAVTESKQQEVATMRFLDGQAPAAHATRVAPSLGDGSRGAGAPGVPPVGRATPGLDRGAD
ncbi:hypothetical protein EV138_7403 [Kribbella voronezhensis]|uniref:Uncharacterized protein n=2 Tax=Kribbella voronezhensis TaxID=2512212 RepID=A0A4R7SUP7_9ACTN|nr:hypothetical protein EV138_7403 [Kribbella voronezhensis]